MFWPPSLAPSSDSTPCQVSQVVFSSGPLLWQAWTALGDVLTPRRLGRSSNKVSVSPADLSAIYVVERHPHSVLLPVRYR